METPRLPDDDTNPAQQTLAAQLLKLSLKCHEES